MIKYLAFFISLSIIGSCVYDPPGIADLRLRIHNTSNSTLFYRISDIETLELSGQAVYDIDTIHYRGFLGKKSTSTIRNPYRIGANKLDTFLYFDKYENLIEKSRDKKLHIFLFKKKTISNYSWEELVAKQIFDAKLDMTI